MDIFKREKEKKKNKSCRKGDGMRGIPALHEDLEKMIE